MYCNDFMPYLKDIEILYNRLFADKNIKSFLQIWNNVITKC